MSAETDEKLANAILSLCDELGQSRAIQQDMRTTLVRILEGQDEISRQFNAVVERAHTQSKRQSESEGKIRSVERVQATHETRIKTLEDASRAGRSA
jgi:hypothetical protein